MPEQMPCPVSQSRGALVQVWGSGRQRALGRAQSLTAVDKPVLGSQLRMLPSLVRDG